MVLGSPSILKAAACLKLTPSASASSSPIRVRSNQANKTNTDAGMRAPTETEKSMDLPPFHHRRYVSFSDDPSFYNPEPHCLPPPPPPPTIPPLPPHQAPPALPPPPPHHLSLPRPALLPLPGQSQFSLRPNPTVEERSPQLSNFIPSHLLNHPRPPPRPPSPHRIPSYHHNNRSQHRFDDNSCFSDPWLDLPLLPRGLPEPPLHHDNHHRPISPLRSHSESYSKDFQPTLRFRDEFVDEGCRDDVNPQLPLWGRKEIRFDAHDHVDDHKYRYGSGRERYEWNSDRMQKDFLSADFQGTDFSLNPSRDFELNVGNYELYNDSEDLRCRNTSLGTDREYCNNNGHSLHLHGVRRELLESSGYEDVSRFNNNRVGEKRAVELVSRSPRKKQLQKKSALQRIQLGKTNNINRNRSHDHSHFPKSYHDDSTSSAGGSFKGKEKDVSVRLEHKMEEEREKSPVELDVSFKSNALVAKAIKATRSPVVDSNRNLKHRNRKIRKISLSGSPGTKLSENLDETESSTDRFDKDHRKFEKNVISDKTGRQPTHDSHNSASFDKCLKSTEKISAIRTDSCLHGSDIPSDSDKDLAQSTKKIRVSVSGNISSGGSQPCFGGLANKESPTSVESGHGVKGIASDAIIDLTARKRKRVAMRDDHDLTSGDYSSADSPSLITPPDEGLSSSAGVSIVSAVALEFHTNVLANEQVKSSSQEGSNMEKDDVDIKSSLPFVLQSSAVASVLQQSGDSHECDAADHTEISVRDGYSGLNFEKVVEHSFQDKVVIFGNGLGRNIMDSEEGNATNKNKVDDSQLEAYTSMNEGFSTPSSEKRLARMSERVDVAHCMNANPEEASPDQVSISEANDIEEGSSNPASSAANKTTLCVSLSELEVVPKETTTLVSSTVDLQHDSMNMPSWGSMDNFVTSINWKESCGDDNCEMNLPYTENMASLSSDLSLRVDARCVSSTNSADRLVDFDPKTLLNNITSSSEDVSPNLLSDMQNSRLRQNEISNGHSGKETIFTKSSVSVVDTVRSCSLNSITDAKVGQALTLPVNSQKLLPLSQNNSKVVQNSNSVVDKSGLSNNRLTIHGGFPGRTSVRFSSLGKAPAFDHVSQPRTWHRTGTQSQSVAGPKNCVSSQISAQKELGKVQSSYVRKGNSLVRKPLPVGAVSQGLHASSRTLCRMSRRMDTLKKAGGSENSINVIGPSSASTVGGFITGPERPKTPPLVGTLKSFNCIPDDRGDSACSQADPFRNNCPGEALNPSNSPEIMDVKNCSVDGPKPSGGKECEAGSRRNLDDQSTIDENNAGKKITYVKRKSNQLVAASNSTDPSLQSSEKPRALSSDGYYKRRKNQLIRTSVEDNGKQRAVVPSKCLISQRLEVPKNMQNRSCSERQTGFARKKFSLVWTLHGTLSSKKDGNSGNFRRVRPLLFPWKRSAYWTNFKHCLSSMPNGNLASAISRKLLFSRKSDTIYKRSSSGFSLRRSKVFGFCGHSLKWSKSIERNSRKANEDATLAAVAAEKRKKEQNGAAFTLFKGRNYVSRKSMYCIKMRPGERIFRIGSERYRMDPTGKTLQWISDEKPSYSKDQSQNNTKKSFVPRRLLIGNDEYVRIGNGNQLVRDPKKRTRVLANEKVRWSLHTARLRLAKKKKYCQFFTRFGKCNKDDKKCPYIHDPSKIAVCTKFLNGSCINSNCKLTHKVIPDRMQDCSYFLQGLCSNESCPYRHVNVNPNSPICEGFLRGYCADGNECRKKHTYVCPVYEATGNCEQGAKCKLHHPKTKKQGIKSKPSAVQKNARVRYFGAGSIDITNTRKTVPKIITGECDDHIFCQDGKYIDFIGLAASEEAKEDDAVEPRAEPSCDSDREEPSDIHVDLEELIKPISIMKKNLVLDSFPAIDSTGEMIGSFFSQESLRMR